MAISDKIFVLNKLHSTERRRTINKINKTCGMMDMRKYQGGEQKLAGDIGIT